MLRDTLHNQRTHLFLTAPEARLVYDEKSTAPETALAEAKTKGKEQKTESKQERKIVKIERKVIEEQTRLISDLVGLTNKKEDLINMVQYLLTENLSKKPGYTVKLTAGKIQILDQSGTDNTAKFITIVHLNENKSLAQYLQDAVNNYNLSQKTLLKKAEHDKQVKIIEDFKQYQVNFNDYEREYNQKIIDSLWRMFPYDSGFEVKFDGNRVSCTPSDTDYQGYLDQLNILLEQASPISIIAHRAIINYQLKIRTAAAAAAQQAIIVKEQAKQGYIENKKSGVDQADTVSAINSNERAIIDRLVTNNLRFLRDNLPPEYKLEFKDNAILAFVDNNPTENFIIPANADGNPWVAEFIRINKDLQVTDNENLRQAWKITIYEYQQSKARQNASQQLEDFNKEIGLEKITPEMEKKFDRIAKAGILQTALQEYRRTFYEGPIVKTKLTADQHHTLLYTWAEADKNFSSSKEYSLTVDQLRQIDLISEYQIGLMRRLWMGYLIDKHCLKKSKFPVLTDRQTLSFIDIAGNKDAAMGEIKTSDEKENPSFTDLKMYLLTQYPQLITGDYIPKDILIQKNLPELLNKEGAFIQLPPADLERVIINKLRNPGQANIGQLLLLLSLVHADNNPEQGSDPKIAALTINSFSPTAKGKIGTLPDLKFLVDNDPTVTPGDRRARLMRHLDILDLSIAGDRAIYDLLNNSTSSANLFTADDFKNANDFTKDAIARAPKGATEELVDNLATLARDPFNFILQKAGPIGFLLLIGGLLSSEWRSTILGTGMLILTGQITGVLPFIAKKIPEVKNWFVNPDKDGKNMLEKAYELGHSGYDWVLNTITSAPEKITTWRILSALEKQPAENVFAKYRLSLNSQTQVSPMADEFNKSLYLTSIPGLRVVEKDYHLAMEAALRAKLFPGKTKEDEAAWTAFVQNAADSEGGWLNVLQTKGLKVNAKSTFGEIMQAISLIKTDEQTAEQAATPATVNISQDLPTENQKANDWLAEMTKQGYSDNIREVNAAEKADFFIVTLKKPPLKLTSWLEITTPKDTAQPKTFSHLEVSILNSDPISIQAKDLKDKDSVIAAISPSLPTNIKKIEWDGSQLVVHTVDPPLQILVDETGKGRFEKFGLKNIEISTVKTRQDIEAAVSNALAKEMQKIYGKNGYDFLKKAKGYNPNFTNDSLMYDGKTYGNAQELIRAMAIAKMKIIGETWANPLRFNADWNEAELDELQKTEQADIHYLMKGATKENPSNIFHYLSVKVEEVYYVMKFNSTITDVLWICDSPYKEADIPASELRSIEDNNNFKSLKQNGQTMLWVIPWFDKKLTIEGDLKAFQRNVQAVVSKY